MNVLPTRIKNNRIQLNCTGEKISHSIQTSEKEKSLIQSKRKIKYNSPSTQKK